MYPSAVEEPWTGGIIPKHRESFHKRAPSKGVVAQVSQTQVSTEEEEDKMALRELKRTKKGKPLTTECQRQ